MGVGGDETQRSRRDRGMQQNVLGMRSGAKQAGGGGSGGGGPRLQTSEGED